MGGKIVNSRMTSIAAALVLVLAVGAAAQSTRWDRNIGDPAPKLIPLGWSGTPVSLEVLRKSHADLGESGSSGSTVAATKGSSGGNTIVLAFWNGDIPC